MSTKKNTDDAKPAAAAASKKQVPALLITAKGESFRRCGFRFGKEPIGIALECLSEEQIDSLKNEPNLIVEEVDAIIDELHIIEAV